MDGAQAAHACTAGEDGAVQLLLLSQVAAHVARSEGWVAGQQRVPSCTTHTAQDVQGATSWHERGGYPLRAKRLQASPARLCSASCRSEPAPTAGRPGQECAMQPHDAHNQKAAAYLKALEAELACELRKRSLVLGQIWQHVAVDSCHVGSWGACTSPPV